MGYFYVLAVPVANIATHILAFLLLFLKTLAQILCFLSVKSSDDTTNGEVRYVKTCQVRSGRLSRWLGCRKALEKLPLFGETNVCTVQNRPVLCATCVLCVFVL